MKKIFLILLSISYATISISSDIEDSIVKVFVTKQEFNFSEPWKREKVKRSTATGFIIEGGKIITNAHAVANHKYIQVRFVNNPSKINVELEYISDDYDLAILKFTDEYDKSNLKPLTLGEIPDIRDKVEVYGFPMGGDKLSITEGIISRIQVHKYVDSQQRFTVLQTDAAINPGNSGGPVIKDNLVIGVAFQGQRRADNIGYLIPSHILKHFLKDIKDGQYDGVPSLGFDWVPLESKIHRRMLGLSDGETGILIKKISNTSILKGKLKTNDVLLRINNYEIGLDGSIEFRNKERVGFQYLLENSNYKDRVEVTVLRDEKVIKENVDLEKRKMESSIAKYSSRNSPTYYIKSGFIFEKLSINYINTYKKSFFNKRNTPHELIGLVENPPTDVDEIIILLSVLSDDANDGYQELEHLVIKKVNGISIRNFQEFIKLTNSNDFIIIEDIKGLTIVIDGALAKERDPIIQEVYNINKMYSSDLEKYIE